MIVIRDIKTSFVVRCSYLNSDSQQQQQQGIIRDVEIGGERGNLGELRWMLSYRIALLLIVNSSCRDTSTSVVRGYHALAGEAGV